MLVLLSVGSASASCGVGPVFDDVEDQRILNKTIEIVATNIGFSLANAEIQTTKLNVTHYSPDISHIPPEEVTGGSACPVADYQIELSLSGKTLLYYSANQRFGRFPLDLINSDYAKINGASLASFVGDLDSKFENILSNSGLSDDEKNAQINLLFRTPFQCELDISVSVSTNGYSKLGELFSYGYIGDVKSFELNCQKL